MIQSVRIFAAIAFVLLVGAPLKADPITLTFEGVTGPVGSFYAGGAGGHFGIRFSPAASGLVRLGRWRRRLLRQRTITKHRACIRPSPGAGVSHDERSIGIPLVLQLFLHSAVHRGLRRGLQPFSGSGVQWIQRARGRARSLDAGLDERLRTGRFDWGTVWGVRAVHGYLQRQGPFDHLARTSQPRRGGVRQSVARHSPDA